MPKVSLLIQPIPKSFVKAMKKTPEAILLQRRIESGKIEPLRSSTIVRVIKNIVEAGKDIVDVKP